MKIITYEDIINLNISPLACYDWVEEAIKNKKDCILPPKISIKPREGVFCNVMPSMNNSIGGVKVVTRYPDREPSLDSNILLMNGETGEFLAFMDGDWVTTMRTGAVAVHSILTFAKKDYSILGFMGLGNTARATLQILLAKEKDKKFTIKLLKYKDQAETFIERFSSYKNITFKIYENVEDIVKGSDVVVSSVTYAAEDFCNDDCFDEGVLLVPIHTRGFTNCDLFFDKIFADDTGHVSGFKNFDKFLSFAEVSDVLNGRAVGRKTDKERIIAYNIGISMHDICFASKIYDLLKSSNLKEIDLKTPEKKFWV